MKGRLPLARPHSTAACLPVVLLWFLIVASCASNGAAQTKPPPPEPLPTPAPFKWGSTQILREITPGETVSAVFTPGAYHGWAIRLAENTSVECRVLDRELPVGMTVVIPDKEYPIPGTVVPESADVGRINSDVTGTVEPVIVIADKDGTYVVRLSSSISGRYSFTCGQVRRTTDTDRQYQLAQKLFLEIRESINAGKPLADVREKILKRPEIYRSVGDEKSRMASLGYVANLAWETFDFDAFIATYEQMLEISLAHGTPEDQIKPLEGLISIYEQRGDYQKVFDLLGRKLVLSKSSRPTIREARAVFHYGVIYHRLADEAKARQYYEEAFRTFSAIEPPTAESLNGMVLYYTNMANLARGMNGGEITIDFFPPRSRDDYNRALQYLRSSIDLNRRITAQFPGTAGLTHFNYLQLANTYKELGSYDDALGYLYGLLDSRRPNDRLMEVRVRILLGSVYIRKRDIPKAVENFDKVIELLKQGANEGNRVGYLINIGQDYAYAGEHERARDTFTEAVELSRARTWQPRLAEALLELGNAERELGNFNNARKAIEEAMQIAETLRLRITNEELRTTYFSTVKRFYDSYIDLLMQSRKAQPDKGFDGLALQISEKARSRTLLDLLTLSGVNVTEGVDPSLLAREKVVREKLSAKALQQSRLAMGRQQAATAKVSAEIDSLLAEHAAIQSEIRAKSPSYAGLTQPSSLSTRDMQALLDTGTVMLEFSLGEKKSYLWVVSNDSIVSYDLPARSDIERLAREVYAHATARNVRPAGETASKFRSRLAQSDTGYTEAARRLSSTILGPAAAQIRNKRLAIVPDGALNYISFAALPLPDQTGPSPEGDTYLGQFHEVVTLASASALARLREDTAGRRPAPKVLAIFADPVFSDKDQRTSHDPRATSQSRNELRGSGSRDFERALENTGLLQDGQAGLSRLPFSRREATSIFANAPAQRSVMHLDFDASKRSVFSSALDEYRILHFATHGLLDTQNPGLSGLVLSLVDRNGTDVDGFVRLQDVYNLRLKADLVVLSACSTALGKEVRGEGLISLTRGFMYAGSPRIVASLWKVDDAATAALMTIFYRKMLVENLRPAAALRAAQNEMRKQPRWRSPYYWAPFVLQGEWR